MPVQQYENIIAEFLELNSIKKCSQCQKKFKDNDKCRLTPCQHIYHKKCLDKWFEIFTICPQCRTNFLIQNHNQQDDEQRNSEQTTKEQQDSQQNDQQLNQNNILSNQVNDNQQNNNILPLQNVIAENKLNKDQSKCQSEKKELDKQPTSFNLIKGLSFEQLMNEKQKKVYTEKKSLFKQINDFKKQIESKFLQLNSEKEIPVKLDKQQSLNEKISNTNLEQLKLDEPELKHQQQQYVNSDNQNTEKDAKSKIHSQIFKSNSDGQSVDQENENSKQIDSNRLYNLNKSNYNEKQNKQTLIKENSNKEENNSSDNDENIKKSLSQIFSDESSVDFSPEIQQKKKSSNLSDLINKKVKSHLKLQILDVKSDDIQDTQKGESPQQLIPEVVSNEDAIIENAFQLNNNDKQQNQDKQNNNQSDHQ